MHLNTVSNIAIALSYFWIAAILANTQFKFTRQGTRLFYTVLSAFILSCAIGHTLEGLYIQSHYWHIVTATVSLASAFLISFLQTDIIRLSTADALNGVILDSIDQAIGVYRIEGDDLRIIYQNGIAISQLKKDMTGELLGEVMPFHKLKNPYETKPLLEIYKDVARDRTPYEADIYYPGDNVDGWYRVKALPAGPFETLITWQPVDGDAIGLEAQILINQVQQALLNKEFTLYYQPIVSLETGEIVGYEALVRWVQSDGSVKYPNEFLSLIERTDLMAHLCYYVIREACETLKEWSEDDKRNHLHIAINLSPLTVGQTDFESRFNAILDEYEIDRSLLQLEITERYALEAPIIPRVRRLKQLGHDILIDDFGTGQSNFVSLKDYPANYVKIDRQFVDGVSHSEDAQAIVTAVISLTSIFTMKIIAEGVESAADAEWLRSNGIEYAQGWLYGRAEPLRNI